MSSIENFSYQSALGEPLTLIDASAGTGKTYSVCACVASRLLEGDLHAEDVAIITFTNAAAHELRSRMRDFLENPYEKFGYPKEKIASDVQVRAIAGLEDATIGTIHHFCEELLALLGTSGDIDPGRALSSDHRMRDRVVNDVALRSLGDPAFARAYAKDCEPGFDGKTEEKRSRDAVLAHLSASAFEALQADTSTSTALVRRYRDWGKRLADSYRRSERLFGLMSNDTLLTLARDALRADAAKRLVRDRWKLVVVDEFQDTDPVQWEMLRKGFIEPLSASRSCAQVLVVGDPKQSIYRFRGADLGNYAQARDLAIEEAANKLYRLPNNFRSDQAVIAATNAVTDALWMGAECEDGKDGVGLPRGHETRRIREGLDSKLLRKETGDAIPGLVVRRLELDCQKTPSKSDGWKKYVLPDLVACVQNLLFGSTVELLKSAEGSDKKLSWNAETGVWTPLEASDIGILIDAAHTGNEVVRELRRAGIPAVFVHSESVFASDMALEWLAVLKTLADARDISAMRQASIGPLGMPEMTEGAMSLLRSDAEQLMAVEWHRLARVLESAGFSALWEDLRVSHRIEERMFSRADGGELYADAQHLSELIDAQWRQSRDISAVASWFEGRIVDASTGEDGQASEEERRRIPSDKSAVQVMTYHGAKGLQFPIVLLPALYQQAYRKKAGGRTKGVRTAFSRQTERLYFFEGPIAGEAQRSDGLGNEPREDDVPDDAAQEPGEGSAPLNGGSYEDPQQLADELAQADYDECGRLAYVALTRAETLTVAWWVEHEPWDGKGDSPWRELVKEWLERHESDLPVCSDGSIRIDDALPLTPSARRALSKEEASEETAPEVLSLEGMPQEGIGGVRTSYSGLVSVLRGDQDAAQQASEVVFEADQPVHGDDDGNADVADALVPAPCVAAFVGRDYQIDRPDEPISSDVNPMAAMPQSGTDFGTMVHAGFEAWANMNRRRAAAVDAPANAHMDADLCEEAAAITLAQHRMVDVDPHALALSMRTVVTMPLPAPFSLRVVDFAPAQTRAEYGFDFALHTQHHAKEVLLAIAQAWTEQIPAESALFAYGDELRRKVQSRAAAGAILDGVMNGEIDLLAQRDDGRYYLIDWKTNRVADDPLQMPLRRHFARPALVREMFKHDYPLQALIYAVAVARMAGSTNGAGGHADASALGGVGYLFVRGIGEFASDEGGCGGKDEGKDEVGSDPLGAVCWQFPQELVERVDGIMRGDRGGE